MPLEQFAPLPLDSVWAIEPNAWASMMEGLKAARGFSPGMRQAVAEVTSDGIGIVNIRGPMTREHSLFSMLFGGTSTLEARDAVEALAGDESVKAILLRLNSPGGSVSGLAELGDAIASARSTKPVIAQVSGQAASAAYYVAAHAGEVYAHRMDMVGSIGTRMMLYDFSAAYAKEGVEAIPIDTGTFKSAGAEGTKITEEHKQYFQSIVDEAQREFTSALATGRKMNARQIEAAADGRVFYAPSAVSMGLLDGIRTEKETLAALRAGFPKKEKGKKVMSAATFADLIVACEGIDPKNPEHASFLCDQLNAEATTEAAGRAWTRKLLAEATAARTAAETAKQEAEAAKATRVVSGAEPLTEPVKGKAKDEGYTGDAVSDFDAAVREKIASGLPRQKAVAVVSRANPDLYKSYLLATNPKRKSKALIEDKFDQE